MIERRSRALFRLSPTPQRSIEVLRLCERVSQSRQVMTIKCLLTEYRKHVGGSAGTFRYFRNRVPVREKISPVTGWCIAAGEGRHMFCCCFWFILYFVYFSESCQTNFFKDQCWPNFTVDRTMMRYEKQVSWQAADISHGNYGRMDDHVEITIPISQGTLPCQTIVWINKKQRQNIQPTGLIGTRGITLKIANSLVTLVPGRITK